MAEAHWESKNKYFNGNKRRKINDQNVKRANSFSTQIFHRFLLRCIAIRMAFFRFCFPLLLQNIFTEWKSVYLCVLICRKVFCIAHLHVIRTQGCYGFGFVVAVFTYFATKEIVKKSYTFFLSFFTFELVWTKKQVKTMCPWESVDQRTATCHCGVKWWGFLHIFHNKKKHPKYKQTQNAEWASRWFLSQWNSKRCFCCSYKVTHYGNREQSNIYTCVILCLRYAPIVSSACWAKIDLPHCYCLAWQSASTMHNCS